MACASVPIGSSPAASFLRSSSASSRGSRSVRIAALATSTDAASVSSLYQVLGVPRGATCREIKAAYRRQARVLHPDAAASGRGEASANEFMQLHEAYLTLSDPEKRANYDRMLLDHLARPFLENSPFRRASSFGGQSRRTWETDQCW